MPTDAEHDAVYRENRRLLDPPGDLAAKDPRWAAVVAFYSAVHLVERLAARDGIHNTRHTGSNSRQIYLAVHAKHSVLLHPLTTLRSASELARYHALPVFDSAFPPDDVRVKRIGDHLRAVEDYVLDATSSSTT